MRVPADPLDAAALDTALRAGQEQWHRNLLEVDWGRTGLYDHPLSDISRAVSEAGGVTLRQEYEDSSPGADVVSSGSSAGRLTITLDGHLPVDGDPVPISALLAPYNDTSPLYGVRIEGTPCRWSTLTLTERGWIATKQFTGELYQRRVRAVGNTVILIAIDAITRLSGPASWPLWAVDSTASARLAAGDTAPQRGLASAVVDAMCNQAGLRTRPRPPWESHSGVLALVSVPLCGSFAQTVGKMRSKHPWGNSQLFPESYVQSPAIKPDGAYWADGVHGLARNAAPHWYPGSLHYTGRDTQPVWTGRSTSISAWIYCGPSAPGYDPTPGSALRQVLASVYFGYTITTNYYANRLSLATDGQTLQIQVEAGSDRHYRVDHTPGTEAWRHVHVQLDHSAGAVRAKMFVDGTEVVNFVPTGTSNSQLATALNVLFLPVAGLRIQPTARCSDVMAWQETGAPTVVPERTFTLGARIDRSSNEITHLPPPNGSRWEVIQDVSSAEYAAVSADADGVLHWRNRRTMRATGEPTCTTTLASAAGVDTVDTASGSANAAECTAAAGEATWQTAWEMATVDQIPAPPGQSTWVFPTDPDVIAVETGTVPRLYQSAESESTVPVWGASVIGGYVFVYDGGEGEELLNQNMVSTTDQSGLGDGQVIRIVVSNTGTGYGRFRFKADAASGTDPRPALRIAGLVLNIRAKETATEVRAASVASMGRQVTLGIGGGPWHQHLPSVRASARHILRRTTQPIPIFDRITRPGDPRLELGDAGVMLLGTSGQRVRVYLAGIARTVNGSGLIDDIAVRATHAPDRWALGDPVLGKLGSTAKVG